MNIIYISEKANPLLIKYIKSKGVEISLVISNDLMENSISAHPDIFMCKMGVNINAPIATAMKNELSNGYPGNIAFNAACTGKYFIHNLKYTNERVLRAAKEMGMILVDVAQGYTKCSIVITSEDSMITYDEGIAKACSRYKDLEVLLVKPGFVKLDGYKYGFLGGTSGLISDEVIFNGDLSVHPDFEKIKSFIANHNLKCKWFPEYELTDIGSIL